MSEWSILSLVAMTGWLILIGAGFASYRLSWGKTAQLALTWLAIFVGLFVIADLAGLSM